jgi:HPt (histidine-containing phosphotransfer) domain-containing protein
MDDFVTKPIDRETMRTVLERWVRARPVDHPRRDVRDTVAGRLALLRNHQPPAAADLAGRVLAAFREGVPERLDAMAAALRTGDAEPLRRHAHDLVGMAGHLGTEDLAALAQDLQKAARDGDLATAGEVVHHLRAEYARVAQALSDLA